MFNNSKWIENSSCASEASPIFKNTFTVSKDFSKVEIAICGVGFYILYINGKRVSDLLSPPFSNYDKTLYYQVYDLAKYISVGKNTIEVQLGNGWYNEILPSTWQFENATWKSNPKFICELTVDGKCELNSNSSWQTAVSKTIYNSLRQGESFDATKKIEYISSANISRGPGGILKKQNMPPVKLCKEIEGKKISKEIYDFGENVTGNVEICVEGKPHEEVAIVYGERVRDDMSFDREDLSYLVFADRFQEDRYYLKGDKAEKWHGEFSFMGLRYAKNNYKL